MKYENHNPVEHFNNFYNNFLNKEVIFSFNKDEDFKKFNFLFKKREIDFFLDKKIINNFKTERSSQIASSVLVHYLENSR